MHWVFNRLEREDKTIKSMIRIYCTGEHKSKHGLCTECEEVYAYTTFRISKCPHKEHKPACTNCEIHCFKPQMKDKIKVIMRYSGPKMLIYHPILSFMHFFDTRKSGKLMKHSKAARGSHSEPETAFQ
jgi:hypothetical protein